MNKRERQAAGSDYSLFESRLGFGGVVAGSDGLLEVFLPFGEMSRGDVEKWVQSCYPATARESAMTKKAAELLADYFGGDRVTFELPIDRRGFTTFQWEVYRSVLAIPYGDVRSYSQTAADIGRPGAARGVGSAMAHNPLPIIIPCHRVVGKGGEMTGYSAVGGVASKQWLLEMEHSWQKNDKK